MLVASEPDPVAWTYDPTVTGPPPIVVELAVKM